jgi:prepilin-type N-terminal cleavage/methylation domain-containing protein
MDSNARPRRGFTLIELLVVIAVIAIIAAILFPVFAQAREKGRAAACFSNMKQIALAFHMYTQDYDERTPGGCFANWNCPGLPGGASFLDDDGQPSRTCCWGTALRPLRPYVKGDQVFVCPSVTGWSLPNTRPALGSYASNRTAIHDSNALASFDRPSETVAFLDAREPWIDDVVGYYIHCRIGNGQHCFGYTPTGCTNCTGRPTEWHNSGVNVIYIDSHAKWSKLSQLTYSQFLVGPQWGLAVTNPRYNCPINVFPTRCNHPGP